MSHRLPILFFVTTLLASSIAVAQFDDDTPWEDPFDDVGTVQQAAADTFEIRDPFFEVCLALIQGDSLGVWTGAELAARIDSTGRATKLPIDHVERVERTALPFLEWKHRHTGHARRVIRLVMRNELDLPLPYSILGYHPGTLYVSRTVEFLEWDLGSPYLNYRDGPDRRLSTERLKALELTAGWVVLDVDGWLDRLLGKKLDDTWMESFVVGHVWGNEDPADDGLQGMALGRSRKGRPLTGSFDFRTDKVLPNGRKLAGAISAVARPVAAPREERAESRAWSWPKGR